MAILYLDWVTRVTEFSVQSKSLRRCVSKVERSFQPYIFGAAPIWEKPGRERHGYKHDKA